MPRVNDFAKIVRRVGTIPSGIAPYGTGASMAIEYAIVLPLLLTFMLGIMDTGRILWTYTTLSRAVAAASRCAAVNITTCPLSAVPAYAASQAWGLGLPSSDFVATTATCGTKVTGTLTFQYFSLWFYAVMPYTNNQLKLTATACYPA